MDQTLPRLVLQVDLLALITRFIDDDSLIRLFMTGDSRLDRVLRQGGAQEFRHVSPVPVCSSLIYNLQQLRLLHIDLQELSPSFARLQLNLHKLPNTLRTLTLKFSSAFTLIQPPLLQQPLAELFPDLLSLSIYDLHVEQKTNHDEQDFALIAGLPPRLRHLRLPEQASFPITALCLLPKSLEYISISALETPKDPNFHLQLPPYLTTAKLIIGWPWPDFCKQLDLASLRKLKVTCFRPSDRPSHENTVSSISALPPSLTALSVSYAEQTWNAPLATALAHCNLTSISIRGCRPESTLEFVCALPPTITSVVSGVVLISSLVELHALPPLLKVWDGMCLHSEAQIFASLLEDYSSWGALRWSQKYKAMQSGQEVPSWKAFPRNMEVLTIGKLEAAILPFLPRSLTMMTTLRMDMNEEELEFLATHCPKLQSMQIGSSLAQIKIATSKAQWVPPSVTSMTWESRPFGPLFGLAWPDGLRRLVVNHKVVPETFFSCLPRSLTELRLRCNSFDMDDLRHLPETLTSLHAVSMISSKIEKPVEDKHLALLPRRLLRLRVSVSSEMTTAGAALLPRNLVHMSMPLSPALNAVEAGSSDARTLHQTLPRFLHWDQAKKYAWHAYVQLSKHAPALESQ